MNKMEIWKPIKDYEMKIFENKEFGSVRMVMIEDIPYFVGKDVAEILGYQNGSRDINRHVEAEDRQNYQNGTFESNRGLTIINESGLYSLILSSKLPKAKEFKRWVTAEILPSIRQTGAYMTKETIEKVLDNPDIIISIASQLKALQTKISRIKKNYMDFLFSSKEVDVSERAYDFIIDYISINESKFGASDTSEHWGKFVNGFIYINKTVLERALESEGFSFGSVKSKWAEKGYLIKNSQDRFVHHTRCYGIKAMYIKLLNKHDVVEVDLDDLPFK